MSDERTTVDIAVGLRDEEWWPLDDYATVDLEDGVKWSSELLARIAWAAAVWLWNIGCYRDDEFPNRPWVGWTEDGVGHWEVLAEDPDPIRATLLAAEAAREQA